MTKLRDDYNTEGGCFQVCLLVLNKQVIMQMNGQYKYSIYEEMTCDEIIKALELYNLKGW